MPQVSLQHERLARESGLVHLTGVQALARLPLDAVRAERRAGRSTAGFISGYEGSPLAGYDLELARSKDLLDEHGIVFQPGVNEELAATAVQGSQLAAASERRTVDGVIGFWYGKSPGLDRATDALRHSNLMGTPPNGGAVALVGDDPAAKSSTVPGASERLLADLGMPTFFPADSQDVLDLGLHAVAMSRASGLWTALKIATSVADGAGTVRLDSARVTPAGPLRRVEHQVTARMLQPDLGLLERSLVGARIAAALDYAAANDVNRITRSGPADHLGLVAAGPAYLDLRQALRALGLGEAELAESGVRLLRLGMISPLEPGIVTAFADGLNEIIVIEEKRPFIETALKELLYGRAGAPAVSGKRTPDGRSLLPADGELDVDIIAGALAARLEEIGGFPSAAAWRAARLAARPRTQLPLVTRTPYFCSGCPHNTSTRVPEGSLVGAGIGCHALVTMMDPDKVGELTGLTQMGGEGAQWIGMRHFVDAGHLLQNLGDGTFHHSGSLAVRAAVASGADITYKVLYNSAVAMTGGQQPAGVLGVPRMARSLLAEGVARIIVTTDDPHRYRRGTLPRGVQAWHRDRLEEAQRVLAAIPGVTVLIHDQECATEARRKRKRGLAPDPVQRVVINERVCEGCGDCGAKSNCLSVQPVPTEFGRKTRIDQSSCNKDYSCLAGDCPAFVTVVPGQARAARPTAPPLDAATLPEPPVLPGLKARAAAEHTTRIAGVGGTGVVTLSQVLATAATLAGRSVRTLDQTGMAQKGGAVISDLKLSDAPSDTANRAAAGECDLYLGCDLLVAAAPGTLTAASADRTMAVVSVSRVPTGQMVADASAPLTDIAAYTAAITEAVPGHPPVFLDARDLSTVLLGEDQFANLLLAGAAYQAGALPIPAARIEEAIAANGVRVEANVQAFRRGRQAVADPAALAAAVARLRREPAPAVPSSQASDLLERAGAPADSELARLLAVRVPDLIAYADERYARQYVELVRRARLAEAEQGASSLAFTEAVARYLYKLMAYKDEYEVARLSLDPELGTGVKATFGDGARFAYRLHPPLLRALGLRRKISLGPWFRPAFRLLYALRAVRGTPLDPFGHTTVRRTERDLVTQYRTLIEDLLPALGPATYDTAVELAALPDLVRGYEEVKLGNVARYRARLAELRTAIGLPAPA
jgi:indolepyruvate ferredoxin oxidoreductase